MNKNHEHDHTGDKRWVFRNIDKVTQCDRLLPASKPTALRRELVEIDHLCFKAGGRTSLSIAKALIHLNVDSIVAIKGETITVEKYFEGMAASTPHILYSASKPFAGALIAILIGDRTIGSENDHISMYLPELEHTAFHDVTIRHLLDMQTGVNVRDIFDKGETERASGYSLAYGDESIAEVVSKLRSKKSLPAQVTDYQSINTDLISMLITGVTHKPAAALIQELIWDPMGSEHEGFLVKDRNGINILSGGLAITARDLARFGTMLVNDGVVNQKQIIPAGFLTRIEQTAEPAPWRDSWLAQLTPQACAYRWHVYVCAEDFDRGSYFAVGNYGNALYICPGNETVIALQSTHPAPVDIERFNTQMFMLRRLARSL